MGIPVETIRGGKWNFPVKNNAKKRYFLAILRQNSQKKAHLEGRFR